MKLIKTLTLLDLLVMFFDNPVLSIAPDGFDPTHTTAKFEFFFHSVELRLTLFTLCKLRPAKFGFSHKIEKIGSSKNLTLIGI